MAVATPFNSPGFLFLTTFTPPQFFFFFFFFPLSAWWLQNSAMKLSNINPAKLFKQHKKSRSVSRSETDPSSFSSHTYSCSDDGYKKPNTPKSVLPSSSEDWSDEVCFELKQAFEMIDRDGEGKIKKEELEDLLRRLGAEPPIPEELKLMLSEVDTDGDGCISLEEFYAIGSAFAPPSCDLEMRSTFDFFDSDHDGKITAEELFQVFKTIGDAGCTLEECRRMIRNVDMKGDGFVCFEDFRRMMVQQR